ncbi:MAG TPA: protein kinase [Ktedonobacteraceae bacterium]|nr:protein kinase [Ktedonobacteraceae bacterium]
MNEKELIGVTLGNCTIERMIGKGGMAIVFLAQQSRPTRTVAIKVLLPTNNDPDQQQVFLERFRREADTIARLEHKNILPLYGYEEATINGQRLAYLIMPYIRGGTLRQRIDEMRHEGRQFDLSTIASYVNQIAEALSYAHSLGVVHRDVKPANLLFHSDGRLLLSDFGIVRLNAMPALTMAGSFIGTAEYASPEQVSLGELDSRSDIYSLGIILYELLTGSVPFTGPTPFAVMTRQLHDPVPSVRLQRPDLSPSIEFVVKKALAKDPKNRYQQANELAADLQAAITPALARPLGFRVGGDTGGNSDLTVADSIGQADPQRARGITTPMPRVVPLTATKPAESRPPHGLQPVQNTPAQLQINAPEIDDIDQVKTYRPSRRLYYYIIGVVTLVMQFFVLGLTLNRGGNNDPNAIVLGVLLGNMLNLISLAAIGFTGITRSRSIRGSFNRALSLTTAGLILSGFFISYGQAVQGSIQFTPTNLPLVSYIILLLTNIFSVRELSKVDAAREQIEVASISWRAAIAGALTGLIPLIIILIFTLVVPLSWAADSAFFLRFLGVLLIGFIGAPTPGAMMAVWLSNKMSFPILVRTSALAGLFMFAAAYVLVLLVSWIVTGSPFFSQNFDSQALSQILPVAIIAMGAFLSLVGLLRGMLDAWFYHHVMLRRP